MTKHERENRRLKRLNRNFMFTKVFFVIIPIICYMYVSLKGSMNGLTFQQVLSQDPNVTVIFLLAMVNPYVAYLVQLVQTKLEQGEYKFACINMILLVFAELLVMNAFAAAILAYLFYHALRYYEVDWRASFKTIGLKQWFYDGGGSLLVILISSIGLFATIRLM